MTENKAQELQFTGERYLPEVPGQLELEHFHRYILASKFVVGKRVLDIASGEGYGSSVMADVAGSVVGVDISQEAVDHARTRYVKTNLLFCQGDAAAIPVDSASVDVVVSFETIEHHDQHQEMMAEIRRVLVPGGLLIISSPNKLNYTDIPKYENPFHVKELYKEEFHALLATSFRHVEMLGQRVVYGSLIVGERSITHGFSNYLKRKCVEHSHELNAPVYDVAFASDAPLPQVELTFYEQMHGEQFAADYLTHELMKHHYTAVALDKMRQDLEAQISVLQPRGQRCEEEIASLREQVKQGQAQITALHQQAKQREVRITGMTELVNRREVEIHDLERQIWDWNRNVAELLKVHDEAKRQVEQLEGALNALQTSTTWRMLGWLRWLTRQRHRARQALALLPGAIRRAGGIAPLARIVLRSWSRGGLSEVRAAASRHADLEASGASTTAAGETPAASVAPSGPEILFISHEASRTGAPIFLLDLIRIVKQAMGVRCTIVLCAGGELEADFRELGDVYVLPARHFVDPTTLAALKQRDIRLIYANTITNGAVQQQLKTLSKPTICHVHELAYSIERHFGLENLQRVVDATDLFLAGSDVVRRYLVDHGNVLPERVQIGYPFIDTASNRARAAQSVPPLELPDDAVVVVACGTICWRKGTDLFLQVAQRVLHACKRPVEFVWIGGPLKSSEYANLRYDAEQLGVSEHLHFPGAVQDHIPYLAQGDIFVLPSREDPFPLVVLDAASLGSPIVCFDRAGGAPELVEKDAGNVVEYMDVDAMAAAVSTLVDDDELRARLGERAKQKVNIRHDKGVVGVQTIEVIKAYMEKVAVHHE
ncbi:glycosyltransferase [Bordetella flabilis]|uniref:Glycosyl transferase family 1 domain-containing protein n=1 Tax=Bordetella flabilis TaxID=463014 RepID=A0A193GJ94_9BORD|nr:glycosyltransferase [Bordetella flabilis]ANN79915.1 hypothetical protein BAU07_24855 [Bordetella flabilis]